MLGFFQGLGDIIKSTHAKKIGSKPTIQESFTNPFDVKKIGQKSKELGKKIGLKN